MAFSMARLLRSLIGLLEVLLMLPFRVGRILVFSVGLNPRLGPLRYVALAAVGYTTFALILVYVVAPIRGIVGHAFIGDKIRYDSERWLATAIYDRGGNFVGTFDPRLDSQRDVNYTDAAIELGDYVANPDHKSIPVREVPPHYWNCLVWHEDRYIGGPLNPYGIDLLGVLKIPYTTLTRSIALKRPSLGVGGSTLPMQFVRVIYKTPPSRDEGGFTKLRRKVREWWLAPVVYHELTRGGDITPLKQWAANHIWLAQRTGGQPLHGVEVTSRIVFGKDAKDLSTAEQFVLASAVNKPIILLTGNDKLNEVRLDRWRYITEVRARTCVEKLITDEAEQKKVLFELIQMGSGPPDARVKPKLQQALDAYAPALARRGQVNPVIRANALMPAARFGLREEMKQAYGFGWREHVRGVTTTLDVTENMAFHTALTGELARLDQALTGKLDPGWTLDPAKVEATLAPNTDAPRRMPNVVVVAANARGEIIRYYESGEAAPYFGSPMARETATGRYDITRDGRMIASTGKILAAIAIANEGHDGPNTPYADPLAPDRNLETCERGNGATPGARRAAVAFACSLNKPIEVRTAHLGQPRLKRLIDGFGFNMPVGGPDEATPPSTAAVLGLIGGAPRRVHHMSAVVLASLIDQGNKPVPAPSLVRQFDYTSRESAAVGDDTLLIRADTLIRREGRGMLKALLQAPLCHRVAGLPTGTLKSLSNWCPDRRGDLRLHFAKTGTHVTADPNATVDAWITGGLQFTNGAAYSYVVLVGTGRDSYGRGIHGAQITPLLGVLLSDLQAHAAKVPMPALLPQPVAPAPHAPVSAAPHSPVVTAPTADASRPTVAVATRPRGDPDWRNEVFRAN
jgi:penicillin-binding protein 1A